MNKTSKVSIREKLNHIWITFHCSIDMDNYNIVESAIYLKLDGKRSNDVVLDFSDTETLFSSGIAVIMRLQRFLAERKKKLYLVNVAEKLYDVLDSASLVKVLKIYSTVDDFKLIIKK